MNQIDWKKLAEEHGYQDDRKMLETLYRGMGLDGVADVLQVSNNSIANRMRKLGMSIKPPGGRNNCHSKIGDKLKGLYSFEQCKAIGETKLIVERHVNLKTARYFFNRYRLKEVAG